MAYYVYLLASRKHGTLYLGVTNDIVRRVYEHRTQGNRRIHGTLRRQQAGLVRNL
jgi:predicted GIY-YIG superfamily endonuclease